MAEGNGDNLFVGYLSIISKLMYGVRITNDDL